jgi:hypothetical protein
MNHIPEERFGYYGYIVSKSRFHVKSYIPDALSLFVGDWVYTTRPAGKSYHGFRKLLSCRTALFDLVPTCLTNSYIPFVCFLALKCTCLACILQPIIIIIIMAAHLVRPCGPRYHWNSQAPRLRVCPVETATCTCSGRPPADSHHASLHLSCSMQHT